jgi:phenylpyruvate tautomerase PptA (4-oxalocrotonate tautomerase family)
MAIVTVFLSPRTQEVRDAIIKGITEVLVANGAQSEGTEVVLYETEHTHWGKGGVPCSVREQQQKAREAAGS